MIDIKQLKPEDVGRWVAYTTPHGIAERGRIKWWNDTYIFIVYHCDDNWDNFHDYTAAATRPEELTFIIGESK